jgi:splicing factor 3B subunit 1
MRSVAEYISVGQQSCTAPGLRHLLLLFLTCSLLPLLLYCSPQGLFHPARKVRQTYWKVYNNLYIGAQDALVAFQPRFPDTADGANTYVRHELDILL